MGTNRKLDHLLVVMGLTFASVTVAGTAAADLVPYGHCKPEQVGSACDLFGTDEKGVCAPYTITKRWKGETKHYKNHGCMQSDQLAERADPTWYATYANKPGPLPSPAEAPTKQPRPRQVHSTPTEPQAFPSATPTVVPGPAQREERGVIVAGGVALGALALGGLALGLSGRKPKESGNS